MRHIPKTSDSKKSKPPVFILDSTLGRLAKWLRLAGMDAMLDTSTPDSLRLKRISDREHRMVLTRTKDVDQKIGPHQCLFIRFNDAMDQARQVVGHFRIQRHQLRFLSRCGACNSLLEKKSRDEVRRLVPDHIFHQHDRYVSCPQCRRIYWPGTHASRIKSVIEGWFTPT